MCVAYSHAACRQADCTLRKRLNEFLRTPAAALSRKAFIDSLERDTLPEHQPPIFEGTPLDHKLVGAARAKAEVRRRGPRARNSCFHALCHAASAATEQWRTQAVALVPTQRVAAGRGQTTSAPKSLVVGARGSLAGSCRSRVSATQLWVTEETTGEVDLSDDAPTVFATSMHKLWQYGVVLGFLVFVAAHHKIDDGRLQEGVVEAELKRRQLAFDSDEDAVRRLCSDNIDRHTLATSMTVGQLKQVRAHHRNPCLLVAEDCFVVVARCRSLVKARHRCSWPMRTSNFVYERFLTRFAV